MVEEKEKKVKEPIKPVLIVPNIDKEKHTILETTCEEDAELLRAALSNPTGVDVRCAYLGAAGEKKKVCPAEPNKPYKESVCGKIEGLFEKKKEEK